IPPSITEEVLAAARPDLLALAQERHELGLDRTECPRVEEDRILDPHELARLHEHLEELVLLVAGHAGPAEGLSGAGWGGLRAAELALEHVDDALLLRREAHLVRSEPRLIALGRDDARGAERRQEEREDSLV